MVIVAIALAVFVPVVTKKLESSGVFVKAKTVVKVTNKTGIDSQADCDRLGENLLFIPASKNGEGGLNLCATKFNAGDVYMGGIEIPSTITVVNAGDTCGTSADYNSKCCWRGNGATKTAGTCTDSGNGDSTYSGCNRTVCTWAAAKDICEAYAPNEETAGKWRLPTRDELGGWNEYTASLTVSKGNSGMQFCDYLGATGLVKCGHGVNLCKGSNGTYCDPSGVWSNTIFDIDTSKQAYYGSMYGGSLSGPYAS